MSLVIFVGGPSQARLNTYEDDAYTAGDIEYGSDGLEIPDEFNIDYVDVVDGNATLHNANFWVTLANGVNLSESSYSWDPYSQSGTGTVELALDFDSDGYAEYSMEIDGFTDSSLYETVNIYDETLGQDSNCTADIVGFDGPTDQLVFSISENCLRLPNNYSFWVTSYYQDSNGNISYDDVPSDTGMFDAVNPWQTFNSGTPTIAGTKKVTKKLTANVGTWGTGATLKYQWYRGSAPISKATKKTYVLTKADKGKRIKVRVTLAKPGYFGTSRFSAVTSAIS